jgi:4-aminobutyrate aminotransferase-like enzyme
MAAPVGRPARADRRRARGPGSTWAFVRDRGTLEPATEETVAICNRMLGLGVIIQPTSNRMCVLKIKPPLCLDTDGADFFADSLDRVLAEGW